MALTKRQKEVLDFIANFVDENGYCPSYEEIAGGLDLASLATVHKHIGMLEAKNYLKRGFNQSRSLVLQQVIAAPEFQQAEYNPAFVLTEYFAYLRRDPDESGYATWLNFLKNKPLRDADTARSVTCGFLNSAEYQNRFGMLTTHDPRECN